MPPKEENKKDVTPFKPQEAKPFAVTNEFNDIAYNFLQIDYTNRKIRTIPGVTIASATKKFLKLSPDFLISGVLDAGVTPTSITGATGTGTLVTYTIPLNMISRNNSNTETAGNVFRIRASGRMTTDDSSSTVAIALKIGSTTYHTITSSAATVTNAPWMIDWMVTVMSIGSSGTAESYVSAKINNINKDASSTSTTAINTTTAQAISLAVSWTSGSAGDDISIRSWLLELLN